MHQRGSPPEAYPTALLQSFEGYPLCIHPRPGQTVSARRSVCLSAERRYDTQAWLSAQADKMENTVLSQHTRPSEVPRLPLRRGRHRAGLPGNVETITGSALTPLRESVTALPAPAYRQEGGASSQLAREMVTCSAHSFGHRLSDLIFKSEK
jgi:hypothetical protein